MALLFKAVRTTKNFSHMKRNFSILMLAVLLVIFPSCEENTEMAKSRVRFELSGIENTLKSFSPSDSLPDPNGYWRLIVSISSTSGRPVFENQEIELLVFGEGFLSDEIELESGTYLLTRFLVVDPSGSVIYATPKEGSPKAQLVNHPLPFEFTVRPDMLTTLRPEVLVVENSSPGEFGYVSFGFTVVTPLPAWVMAVDDNPLYQRPSMIVPAYLSIITPNGEIMEYQLEARPTKIYLKEGYRSYHFRVENQDYPPLEIDVSAEKLRNSTQDNPVIFNLSGNEYKVLRLQPGPEDAKDAMITDLNPDENFGTYDYFECSFITEPVLTVMRTKWSLIDFDLSALPKSAVIKQVLLQLQFETPLWDSLYESQLEDFMLWKDSLVFRQIVEEWDEHTVTWNNQPATLKANQVVVPEYPQLSTNMRTYDVTSLFVPEQEISAPNYGFMFRHADKDFAPPGGMKFASGDHPEELMRPGLLVRYN